MSSIEKKLDQLIKNVADLSNRINSVDQKLDKINERLDLAEIKMDQNESRIDELEGRNSDLESLVHSKLPQDEFEAHLKDFNEIKSLSLNFQKEACGDYVLVGRCWTSYNLFPIRNLAVS